MFLFDSEVGFEPNASTYYAAIIGNALREDMPAVKKVSVCKLIHLSC